MKRYFLNKPMFIIVLCVIGFLTALKMIYYPSFQGNATTYDISVLCAKGDSEHFLNYRQGALQAAEDLKVNLRFLYSKYEDSGNHQIKLLQQELKNDTNALIMIPYSDSFVLQQRCSEATKPIVYAYSHVIKGERNYIGSNGSALGVGFANHIINEYQTKQHIAILVKNDLTHTEKEICESMQEQLRSQNHHVEVLSFHSQENTEHLHNLLNKNKFNIVVCFEDEFCSQLIAHKEIHDIEIYAMGSKYDVISALEKEELHALLVQDDYSIGYLSVKAAVDSLKNGENIVKQNIRYAIVDKAQMYQSSNERLLFPIVR